MLTLRSIAQLVMHPTEGTPVELVYLCLTLAVLLALLFGLRLFQSPLDEREPPLVSPSIPVFGHVLGLLRHGMPYLGIVIEKLTSSPIYTFNLFFTKVYAIKTGKLVSAVQRNHKNLSFDPYVTAAAKRMVGITGVGLHLLQEKHNGGCGVNQDIIHAMHPALLGPGLDEMNQKMISGLCESIDALSSDGENTLDLHAWCKHSITVASTRAVWGPKDPYQSESLRSAFWLFESNINMFVLDLWPKYTANPAWTAREKIVKAFTEYFIAGGQHDSSAMTMARWKTQHDAGSTIENIARMELANSVGVLSNTVPSTFWTIFEIYSREKLLADIREEVKSKALVIKPDTNEHIVDLGLIRDSCPKLLSAFQEVLRFRSSGATTRAVYNDVMLDDRYLLKAGSVVQILATAVHKEEKVWGSSAQQFDPSRFNSITTKGKDPNVEKPRPTSFVSFGASPNMCLGRQFAVGEILALTAMLVLRYDIRPVSSSSSSSGGKWWTPKLNAGAVAASVSPPGEAYPVKVSARKEYAGASWSFRVTEGKGKFGLIVG